MKKTIENLKPGDTCYCLGLEPEITKVNVSRIDGNYVVYQTGFRAYCYSGGIGTCYETYSYVYFNLSDALEELRDRMNLIKKEIEKWTTSGQD